MSNPVVVSREAWLAARKALLAQEKALTRARDALSDARRALPWVKVEKSYMFEAPGGRESLTDLFAGRGQLIVYHFMFGPDWDEGCPSCSFWADNFNGIDVHLAHRDATLIAISRAPLAKIAAYRARLGWTFKWVSSAGNDFNRDFGVSFTQDDIAKGEIVYNYAPTAMKMEELPGVSVFARDAGGAVFHTYSCYARGLDMLNGAYHYMDLLPKGRDEAGLPWSMAWLRRRDQYES
jgi:predicted dithiol-disulfide oxidoreductase (DUF899 family)